MAALPTFYMSLMKIPISVALKLGSICRKFLWAGTSEARRINYVSWDEVCKNKYSGGLGIPRILEMNNALLMKWWWRFGTEE